MATYQAVLQAAPQNVLAMVNLARLYAPQDLQKAFNLAKAAYNLTPNDPLVTHTLGRLAFQTGDFKWALSQLQLTAQNNRKIRRCFMIWRRPFTVSAGCRRQNRPAKFAPDRSRLCPNR